MQVTLNVRLFHHLHVAWVSQDAWWLRQDSYTENRKSTFSLLRRRRPAKTRPSPVRPPSSPPDTNRRIVMWARLLRSHVTPIVPVQRPFTVFRCDREEFVRALPFTKCSTAIFPDVLQFSFALSRWYHLSLFDHVICKSLIREKFRFFIQKILL